MRNHLAILIACLLLLGTPGCGGSAGKASVKAGDPTTKNTADPPDATRLPVKRR